MQILVKLIISAFLIYGIAVVWTYDINPREILSAPFKKMFHLHEKTEIPEFQAGIINLMNPYKEGLLVDNITWKNGYQECRFVFDNLTKHTEITNFKIDIQIPGGIIFFEKYQSYGFDDLNISTTPEKMGIGQGDEINKLVNVYTNHLHITASKVFPQSHIAIKIILLPLLDYNNGFIKYSYDYINGSGNRMLNDFVYMMPYTVKDNFVFFSVDPNPAEGPFDYNIKQIPTSPILFEINDCVTTNMTFPKERD